MNKTMSSLLRLAANVLDLLAQSPIYWILKIIKEITLTDLVCDCDVVFAVLRFGVNLPSGYRLTDTSHTCLRFVPRSPLFIEQKEIHFLHLCLQKRFFYRLHIFASSFSTSKP